MAYFTPEEIQQAKRMDLLTYLQTYEPNQLVKVSNDTYCTKDHDSLKISNGKWHWFSRNTGGRSALDYLVKVRGLSFLEAMETIHGKPMPRTIPAPARKQEPKALLLPERNGNADRVIQYLKGRGIHDVVIRYCLENHLLFESREYHSAVFLGYDKGGAARYGSVRGTVGGYKGELSGSDKHYSFSVPGNSETVHVFESAIDALSYATLELFEGRNWHEDHLLSLAGVYITKRENVVPVALSRYLEDHPEVRVLRLHLDNDAIGRGAAAGIVEGLRDQYAIFDEPPVVGKDVNDQLQMRVGLKCKEEYSR
ncbi:MAG: DUF3991 and toprim domain-containing protein [Clostridiales bacterium]|nr:DUF3991 and toprim domain-containing protein [Clostridiales bacterium]